MDLALEANRNSALFNTFQQALDVYNPLLHKARPTVVNQTKHRIRAKPTNYANTFDQWSGARTVTFDMPRIGSLIDFSLKCAFQLPGTPPTTVDNGDVEKYGYRGYAKDGMSYNNSLKNSNDAQNGARGRLDRVYADRLLGFNMIQSYTVSSKSRQLFTATGEYLLVRFSQMDADMKEAVMRATTPVDILAPQVNDTFYAPGITYNMSIPLFMFFNEHITSALDVNFTEEVHVEINLRAPADLFWYGQLGDVAHYSGVRGLPTFTAQTFGENGASAVTVWDQAVFGPSITKYVSATGINNTGFVAVIDSSGGAEPTLKNLANSQSDILFMQMTALQHIQGIGPPYTAWGTEYLTSGGGTRFSGPTFRFENTNNLGESPLIQFEGNADYLIQDTDAARQLRAEMFPEGKGLTTIGYNTTMETYRGVFRDVNVENTLLSVRNGGSFADPMFMTAGINLETGTRYMDFQLRTNNLCMATHFMVRKTSDLGGDSNTNAGDTEPLLSASATSVPVGAHQIYTRCLPIQYFQLLAAGRVLYESDGKSQLNLTQSGMYNGTGLDFGTQGGQGLTKKADESIRAQVQGRPMNIYTINYGLQANRNENTGCLSFQNTNNPTLRIYFLPEDWAEFSNLEITGASVQQSPAQKAAKMGVRVDVIHEFFNVITINSGNGEITSGLNQ